MKIVVKKIGRLKPKALTKRAVLPLVCRGIMDIGLIEKPAQLSVAAQWNLKVKAWTEDWIMSINGALAVWRAILRETAAAALVMGLILQSAVLAPLPTAAYFTSIAEAASQAFTAGTLDISVNPAIFSAGTIKAGDSASGTFTVNNAGSLPLQFTIEAIITSEDPVLCQALELQITRESMVHSSSLAGFISPAVNLDTGSSSILNLTLTLPAGSLAELQDKGCSYSLVFNAWQKNLPDSAQGFMDNVEIAGSAGSGIWIFDPVKPGDVIINEIMWMGSEGDDGKQNDDDEWIELRNTTDHDLVINNWNIYGAVSGSGGHLEIPNGHVIPAYGYYLISNKGEGGSAFNVTEKYKNTSINFNNDYNKNGQLVLTNKVTSIVYDKTPLPVGAKWPTGRSEKGKRWSMERNLDAGDGTLASSWHTCDRSSMSEADLNTMKSYWDSNADNFNCGTPGAPNLSRNDPTAPDYPPLAASKILYQPVSEFVGGEEAGEQPEEAAASPVVHEDTKDPELVKPDLERSAGSDKPATGELIVTADVPKEPLKEEILNTELPGQEPAKEPVADDGETGPSGSSAGEQDIIFKEPEALPQEPVGLTSQPQAQEGRG